MLQLLQSQPAVLDLVLRTDAPAGLHGLATELGAGDVLCQLKRAGADTWNGKALSAGNFRDAQNGAYLLSLDAADTDTLGTLLVLATGRPGLAQPILPSLLQLEVVVARSFRAARPDLDKTIVIGQLVGLDGLPLARATVTATLLQVPLLLQGVAVAGDAVIASSDDDGFFELPLITGATVDVVIAAARYRRTLVVPRSPAVGTPVRLFSIP